MKKASLTAEGSQEPICSYSTFDDFKILCGSNTPYALEKALGSSGRGEPRVSGHGDSVIVTPPKTSRHILQELRHIDELPVREQFKIAVLYVGPGQFRQR
jgi:hypothetical protein